MIIKRSILVIISIFILDSYSYAQIFVNQSTPKNKSDSLKTELLNAKRQASHVNAKLFPPTGYQQVFKTSWGYWGIGNFEEVAFEKDDILIAIYSYSGFAAPPIGFRSLDYTSAGWVKMHNERLDSIAKSFSDKEFPCAPINGKYLTKINADKGYTFINRFKPNNLYRKKYDLATFILLQKNDLGRILIVYYYKTGNKQKIPSVIKNTAGIITFNNDSEFYMDQSHVIGQKTIYLGKFSYANAPEVLEKDSIEFEKRKLKHMIH